MVADSVIYQRAGPVGIITINRPEANNAINAQVAEELVDICSDVSLDEGIKVVIVTAAGESAFSIGTDPYEIQSGDSIQDTTLFSVAVPVANLNCPTIAAINGDALGQGLELALACDLRIAAEIARFGLPYISSGIIPWDGATQRLPRLIGVAKAMEMVLTGEIIDAREACRIGLVSKIVPPKELIPIVNDMGQAMASQSPLALNFAKEAINDGLDLTLEQGLRLEADLYFLLHTTEDRTEGIKAFLEKRPPKFKGK